MGFPLLTVWRVLSLTFLPEVGCVVTPVDVLASCCAGGVLSADVLATFDGVVELASAFLFLFVFGPDV